jgi:glucose-1-phosphate adenylyltransferase
MKAVQPELARTEAFILAGGQGERLYPLTISRPKPAVSFGGMFRIIDFTLSNCLHSSLGGVSILTQYQHEELHRYIRQGWSDLWNSSAPNRSPLVCRPPASGKRYRGTADAVFRNAEVLNGESDFVLILSGDHIYQMDYGDLLKQHIKTNADLTIATVEHPLREASHFGVLEVDESFRVTGFQEKPIAPRPLPFNSSMALVSMGVYVFKKAALLDSLRAVCDSGAGYDFGHDVIPALIRSARVFAYDFRDKSQDTPRYWRDIGTIDAYHTASMDLVQPDALFDPYANDEWPSQPTRHPRPAKAAENPARVEPGSQVTRTVLSPGVQVEQGAAVCESVLMPAVRVGKGAHLRRAIVEEGIHIPPGFRAGFDLETDREHHTVTGSGIVVINHNPAGSKTAVLTFAFNGARTGTGRQSSRRLRSEAELRHSFAE